MGKLSGRKLTWLAGATTGLLIGSGLLNVNAPIAEAQTPDAAACYRLTSDDTPFADETFSERHDVWCYQELERPRGAKFIFNVDDNGRTSPELSFVVEPDGSITHSSLMAGERSIHRLAPSDFAPLPVPLSPPPDAERIPQPISPTATRSSNETLEVLTATAPRVQDIAVRLEGNFTASVVQEALPWRGYWFPHSSGKMHRGANSPMAKFDKFIKLRTGTNPGAQKWEARRHGYTGINWAGHCNGWAAASILEKEPTLPWRDPFSGVEFSSSDLKGLLMEFDYCPAYAFFGRRYRGRPGDNQREVPAAVFHNTIRYYIGELKKPVLADVSSSEQVENRVFSGYEMKVKKLGTNIYRVDMNVMVHGYDTKLAEDTGIAPAKPRKYSYKIWTDEQGNVKKGSWISSNPDFLWVPVGPGRCKDQNPALTPLRMKTVNTSAPVARIW